MLLRASHVLLCLLLILSSGCASSGNPHWVELKGQRYQVELARDDAARARGLMFRDALADDAGMLFLFDHQEPLSFWMLNTRIPLDILYFDQSLRLVSVAQRVPPCNSKRCPSYPSNGPARFVLELNAGHARKLGVSAGDTLTLAPAIHALVDPPPDDPTSKP